MGMGQPGKPPHRAAILICKFTRFSLTSRCKLRLWGIRRQDFRFSVAYNTPAS